MLHPTGISGSKEAMLNPEDWHKLWVGQLQKAVDQPGDTELI